MHLFGSAVNGMATARDVDLLVEIVAPTPAADAEHFLALKGALESHFRRPVDLLTEASLANPYLRKSIDARRAVLFEA